MENVTLLITKGEILIINIVLIKIKEYTRKPKITALHSLNSRYKNIQYNPKLLKYNVKRNIGTGFVCNFLQRQLEDNWPLGKIHNIEFFNIININTYFENSHL